ncbi:hypothetical protein [Paenibacillus arenilitoris]|uniref:Uncharacterized protein n=1 Tax=Paenibacillus arenilitoris TaxID=2772299 RepID=A0A927H9N2_9BACL|nr:hypothetical protein [Paenibacillus arenilitoris]MBD2872913.1 hypothetical protein [Paenibacillus arenilitoris]
MLAGKGRHVIYLLIAAAMLVYAAPRLALGAPWDWTSAFGIVWVLFALVVIAAHANALLMSDEKRKELARIKRARAQLLQRKLERKAPARRARG